MGPQGNTPGALWGLVVIPPGAPTLALCAVQGWKPWGKMGDSHSLGNLPLTPGC